jgi:hypothetical protein
LLFSITLQVELLDGLDSDFLLLEENLIGFGGEIIGELLDVIGESGREQNILHSRRKHSTASAGRRAHRDRSLPLDPLGLITQTLKSNHLVGLIKDKDSNMGWIKDGSSPREHIHKGTRGTDKNVLVDFLVSGP